jgi:quercetin 2,3-dioxygenase
MNTKRKLETVYTPPAQAGFLGRGHIAKPVVQVPFSQSDPFILLMDDILDKQDDIPVGGPHPHAGFETVTLLIEGELGVGSHVMKAGDFEMMTAGSGIVHTETIAKRTRMRLMQLWLNLPKHERKAPPRVQGLKGERVPVSSSDGFSTRVYSGSFAGVTSPIQNYTPVIIADVVLEANASTVQSIPGNYTTFLYVLSGSVRVGEGNQGNVLSKDQVGWLNRGENAEDSDLVLSTPEAPVRFLLYSAEPQRHEIVSNGPFIADTMDEIRQLYADFRQGKMGHISEVPLQQQLVY